MCILAAEVAKATGGHLTVCAVNIAHGGVRGPTISHWKADEVAKLLADAEAVAKTEGATDVGVTEIVAREAAPAIIAYAEQNGYTHIVMGTGDKRGLQAPGAGVVASEVATQRALHGDDCPLSALAHIFRAEVASRPRELPASGVCMFTSRKKI